MTLNSSTQGLDLVAFGTTSCQVLLYIGNMERREKEMFHVIDKLLDHERSHDVCFEARHPWIMRTMYALLALASCLFIAYISIAFAMCL